jgi:hypothetical protein
VREHILPYADDADKEVRHGRLLLQPLPGHRQEGSNAGSACLAETTPLDPPGPSFPRLQVRQAAALACCRVLERHASAAADARRREAAAAAAGGGGAGGAGQYGAGAMGLSARQTRGIEAVVGRLLMAAVADTSEHVRRSVLKVRPRGA